MVVQKWVDLMNVLIVASIVLLMSSTVVCGQIRASVSKEIARHHWYAMYRISHHSAAVEYTIGEFVLKNPRVSRPIYMSLSVDQWLNGGSNEEVVPAALGSVQNHTPSMRTRCFRIPDSASVSFFRLWSYASSIELSQNDMKDYVPRNWPDVRWVGGRGRLKDTPTVVIELVDSISGAVVMTIDSVGACDDSPSVILRRFGTVPDSTFRCVPLPSSLVDRVVYLRAVPLIAEAEYTEQYVHVFSMPFNKSYLYEDELARALWVNTPRWLDSAAIDTIGKSLYEQVILAHEASLSEYGCSASFPGITYMIGKYEGLYDEYKKAQAKVPSRANCEEIRRADTLWWLSTLDRDLPSKRTPRNASIVYDNTSITIAGGRAASGVSISLKGCTSRGGAFNIYDMSGQTVLSGITPSIPFIDWKPINSSIPSGVYLLQIKLETGREFSKTFTIVN